MTDEWIPADMSYKTEPGGDGVEFRLQNYPASSTESVVKPITFGSVSTNFALLIEVDGATGALNVVIGNGPDTADVPRAIPDILREVADIIEGLDDNEEFLSQVQ